MRIIRDNFMNWTKDVKDNQFDLLLIDPDYGLDINKKMSGFMKNINKAQDDEVWDKRPPNKEEITELIRISKHQVIFGWQYFCNLLEPCSGFFVWDKENGKNYFADFESAWTNWLGGNRIIRYKHVGCFQFGKCARNIIKIHPTQKPSGMLEEILKKYMKYRKKEKFSVIDTYAGSGSTGEACLNLGLEDVVLIEQIQLYYDRIIKRIEYVRKRNSNEFYIPNEENVLFKGMT
jgi:site-specific DNA-methyltransferase (adenine-specific)